MFSKPILFIVFNRPDLTARIFEVIKKIKPVRLYVAADGPRADRSGETELCAQTRRLATAIDWPGEVKTRFLDKNAGCHTAVPAAISWFFSNEEEGIILEDDCLADPSFFSFCEELLEIYHNDEEVLMISGDNFQATGRETADQASYYFSKYANIWGWATWRRAWADFIDDFQGLDDRRMKTEIKKSFSSVRAQNYWYGFYKKIKTGRLINWDAKWSLSLVYNGGRSLIPNVNLVRNIGFGPEATHSAGNYHLSLPTGSMSNIIHPKSRAINYQADNHLFRAIYFKSLGERLFLKIKSYFK